MFVVVNKRDASRIAVLQILRKTDSPVSGTSIGTHLGISRVAVRKHILKLINEGFFIETGKHGYRLKAEPDYPTPSDFDTGVVHIRNEVESTMDEAFRNARDDNENIQFFLARTQKAGRGRNRKSWMSPEGGLYLTAVFGPRLPASYISLYVIQSGLFMSDFLRKHYEVESSFRWPNDIYIGNRKLGGLLIEVSGPAESPDRAFLGVGLNVSSTPRLSGVSDRAVTSLQQELPAWSCNFSGTKQLFTDIKPVLESSLARIEPEMVREGWRNNTDTVGIRMNIEGLPYTVRDLALNGSLIVSDHEGNLFETAPGPKIMGPV